MSTPSSSSSPSSSRRDFLGAAAAVLLAACKRDEPHGRARLTAANVPSSVPPAGTNVLRRPLGATGQTVSAIGLGGFHLGQAADEGEATRIVHEALEAGVDFFDNAWEYNDGRSEDWLGKALSGGKRAQAFVMTKVCTHGRSRDVAMRQLEDSLGRLRTDHLDLWQIHECVYDNDPDLHFAADGVVRALEDAKRQGKVRFVGFTGHKDPKIHLAMLARGFAFDTVQMPLNVFDATFRSFETQVVPEAVRRRMGVIGMKSLGGLGLPVKKGVVAVEEALRYAMSVPGVSVTVTGVDSPAVLRQNLAVASGFIPMTDAEKQALRDRLRPLAADGRFEIYKTTARFDAAVGRAQHGFPAPSDVPL